MSSMLNTKIKRIEARTRARDPDALVQASKLIEQYPCEAKAWNLRAYVFAREKKYTDAIDDLTSAIDLCPTEPCLLHSRGRYYTRLGDYQRAIDDFTCGLAACDLHSSDYYREEFYFHRAYAYLRFGNKAAALEDLKRVRDDYLAWTDRLCTKQELLAECS
jgi:tetratricopeptide (TPR) repeat protein